MEQPPLEVRSYNIRSRPNGTIQSGVKKRPLSRASNTSLRSATAQPLLEQIVDPVTADFHRQWYEQNAHATQRFGGLSHQMTPEEIFIQSASHVQNTREFDIDPSLGNTQHGGNPQTFQQESAYGRDTNRQSVPTELYGASYGEVDIKISEGRSDEQDEVESVAGVNGPVKKLSKSSAANELEMRQLFQANKNRSLPDVAAELHGNERGPQSERQRQVFAMLWQVTKINQVCSKGKGSVPRGRVYSNYVSRCATERVTVLNPASFGKLVRVLFPGLKTRRLGVRGESKYHYVNFSLEDDQPDLSETQKSQMIQNLNNSQNFINGFGIPSQTPYPIDRAAFTSTDVRKASDSWPKRNDGYIKPHSLYHHPNISNISQLEASMNKIPQRLQFSNKIEQFTSGDEPISLPNISLFIPDGTDPDSASALTALYRSHCTSLVDALRFCKEKTFFHLFSSFHGTLTMPVQKLFSNPEIAPWIEECDFAMYQKMMRVVAPLTLQVAPKPVLDTLRNISERLVLHIQSCFQGHPAHVLEAKIAPATLFAGLLDRELRVNLTAHAAANMLSNPANRDQMYEEWITMVRTRKIAESVPTRGMDDVVNLILNELRYLLNPVGVNWELESKTLYGEMALRSSHQQQSNLHTDPTTENVLDRWVTFLTSLPAKFPYATHAEIVWSVQSVGTTVMRDITISQGKSFGAWWVTKCWIDEMIAFLAEQGGFMEYKTSESSMRKSDKQMTINLANNNNWGRYNIGSESLSRENSNLECSTTIAGVADPSTQAGVNTSISHDDSGIDLRTPDDDFVMEKYNYGQSSAKIDSNSLGHDGLRTSAIA
ncbi:Transcriptional regulator RFX1 [Golovinomyces cichoracearum]|uniref:Transcriptional regulator RFX1 n=1 Tax=Golovinomyces cichoracearum TaxID=62708 RepID=A0A420IAR9_9PEZI|nr:Transcriptional regulator RFX1 [Golovinomyces cichoracearum]